MNGCFIDLNNKTILTDSSLKRTNKLPLFILSLYLRIPLSTFGIEQRTLNTTYEL